MSFLLKSLDAGIFHYSFWSKTLALTSWKKIKVKILSFPAPSNTRFNEKLHSATLVTHNEDKPGNLVSDDGRGDKL